MTHAHKQPETVVMKDDLRSLDSHFSFGKNWRSYANLIDEAKIAKAVDGLRTLIPEADIRGRSFLDIGCGSGLHALSALRLGAARVHAVDIDPESVATTRDVLAKWAGGSGGGSGHWTVETKSILDPAFTQLGAFDIVYSWGVLHHTGAMWPAIETAADSVGPDGLFCLALYRTTRLDRFWRTEKRWYKNASPRSQSIARGTYDVLFRTAAALTGRRDRVGSRGRGMEYWHDMHDWLGGYPYETALAPEVETRLASRGFIAERVFARTLELGLFGSGCDEYVYRKRASR